MDNFADEVIEQSKTVPVLVDFWAEWCGPCRMLTPVLEKLEAADQGKWKLVKVNTDQEQDLARQFQVTGIPAVKMFVDGRLKDEFTGALPEPNVRIFLNKNLPDDAMKSLLSLAAVKPREAAALLLARPERNDGTDEIFWTAFTGMMQDSTGDAPDPGITPVLAAVRESGGNRSDARNAVMRFLSSSPNADDWKHFRSFFTEASQRSTLEHFLARVESTRGEERTAMRNAMLACFYVIGQSHPLSDEYGRRLASLLY